MHWSGKSDPCNGHQHPLAIISPTTPWFFWTQETENDWWRQDGKSVACAQFLLRLRFYCVCVFPHGACMWIAEGCSCWFEAARLSISFTRDVWTVMFSRRPGATRETQHCSYLLLLSLLLLCLKSEDFYICMLLLCLQSASAHADQVRAPSGTYEGTGCKGM